MHRYRGSVVASVVFAAVALSGCSVPPATEDAEHGESDSIGGEPTAPTLDLTSDEVLREFCKLNDQALDSDAVVNRATQTPPEYWTANLPLLQIDDLIYCEQTLASNGRTNTWVILDTPGEDFPKAKHWLTEVEAAGYSFFDGAEISSHRQIANGELTGSASSQWYVEGKPLVVGLRSFDSGYLQVWIQPPLS